MSESPKIYTPPYVITDLIKDLKNTTFWEASFLNARVEYLKQKYVPTPDGQVTIREEQKSIDEVLEEETQKRLSLLGKSFSKSDPRQVIQLMHIQSTTDWAKWAKEEVLRLNASTTSASEITSIDAYDQAAYDEYLAELNSKVRIDTASNPHKVFVYSHSSLDGTEVTLPLGAYIMQQTIAVLGPQKEQALVAVTANPGLAEQRDLKDINAKLKALEDWGASVESTIKPSKLAAPVETTPVSQEIQTNEETRRTSLAPPVFEKDPQSPELLIGDQKQAPSSPTEPQIMRRLRSHKDQVATRPEVSHSYEKAVDEYLESFFDFSSQLLDIYTSYPDRATAIKRGMDLVTFLFQLHKAPKDVPLETIEHPKQDLGLAFWFLSDTDTREKMDKAYKSMIEKYQTAINEKSKFLRDDYTDKKLQTPDIVKMKQFVDHASKLYPNETLDIKKELAILQKSIRIRTVDGKSTVHQVNSLGSEKLPPYEYTEKFKAFYTSALYFDMQSSDLKKYEESIKRYLARIKAIDIWYKGLPQSQKQP